MSQKTIGLLQILTASVLFGINSSLSRLLFDRGVTPITLVEFRMLVGGICLFAFLGLRRGQSLRLSWRMLGWVIAFGLAMALVTYTYFVAISRVPLAVALVIQFTAPVWLLLGSSLWQRKIPSRSLLFASILTVGGVGLVTEIWHQQFNGLDSIGLLFACFALVTFLLYFLLGKKVGIYLPPISATAYGALVASLFWLLIQPPWAIPASTWNPHLFVLIVLVGIIGMALPFSLEMAGLRRLDATRAGIAAMFELPASAAIAFAWLGQDLSLWQLLGCGLVLAGITMVQLENEKPLPTKASPENESVPEER